MNRVLFFLFGCLAVLPVFSQSFDYSKKIHWSETMKAHVIPDSLKSYPAVIVLDERIRAFEDYWIYADITKKRPELQTYFTQHLIIRIQADSEANKFNRIEIVLYKGQVLKDMHWRILHADGSVVVPGRELYKDSLAGEAHVRVFDLEGLRGAGTELEYTYTIHSNFVKAGVELFRDNVYPLMDARFVFSDRPGLIARVKGYNGFVVSPDSAESPGRNLIAAYARNLPTLPHEIYSIPGQYIPYVSYSLQPDNMILGVNKVIPANNWNNFSYGMMINIINHNDKEEAAAIELAKSLPLTAGEDLSGRIRVVDDYVKTHFRMELHGLRKSGNNSLLKVISLKAGSPEELMSLYAALFNVLNISYEIVFPGNRDGIALDPEMGVGERLQNPLFYFPGTGNYLQPGKTVFRYPYINPKLAGTQGVFLTITAKESSEAPTDFHEIAGLPADSNTIHKDVDVRLNRSLDTAVVAVSIRYTGYPAINGISRDTVMHWPWIVRSQGTTAWLNIGALIGKQEQVVDRGTRSLPIDLMFPYQESWTINLHIPPGYTVKNTSDLETKTLFMDADGPSMGFMCKYKQMGDTLQVTVRKGFLRLQYPVSAWENFTTVLQSAVDFGQAQIELVPSDKG